MAETHFESSRIAALVERMQRHGHTARLESRPHADTTGRESAVPSSAHLAERVTPAEMSTVAGSQHPLEAGSRLEAAVARLVQARAARPARGDPELGQVGALQPAISHKRLGELLIERRLISGAQRDAALSRQAGSGRLFGEILVEAGALTAEELARTIRDQSSGRQTTVDLLARIGMPAHQLQACLGRQHRSGESLTDIIRDWSLLTDEAIAKIVALENGLEYLPWTEIDNLPVESVRAAHIATPDYRGYVPIAVALGSPRPRVSVALADTRTTAQAAEALKSYHCHFHVATRDTCETIHRRFFAGTAERVDDLLDAHWSRLASRDEDPAHAAAARQLLAALLLHACYTGASGMDLHRSNEAGLIRLKSDGVWRALWAVPCGFIDRVPQLIGHKLPSERSVLGDPASHVDLRALVAEAGGRDSPDDLARRYVISAEVCETPSGPCTTLHIRDRHLTVGDLGQLGFPPAMRQRLCDYMHAATGLVLVSGPSSSGRSSTLYSLLRCIDPFTNSIRSFAPPIKYAPGLWRHAISSSRLEPLLKPPQSAARQTGNSASDALPGPQKILAGRLQTAVDVRHAFRAAESRSLVIAAVDASGAVETIRQFESLGVSRCELGAVLRGIVSQRLVRKLCSSCKIPDDRLQTDQALATLDLVSLTPPRSVAPCRAGPSGCPDCGRSGYRGRRLVPELLHCGKKIRDLLETEPRLSALRSCIEGGTLRENGLALVAEGITSLDELAVHVDLED